MDPTRDPGRLQRMALPHPHRRGLRGTDQQDLMIGVELIEVHDVLRTVSGSAIESLSHRRLHVRIACGNHNISDRPADCKAVPAAARAFASPHSRTMPASDAAASSSGARPLIHRTVYNGGSPIRTGRLWHNIRLLNVVDNDDRAPGVFLRRLPARV